MEPTFRDRAVVVDETLVLADLHLGRAATSVVEAPVDDGSDVLDRLSALLAALELERIVLAGDVLHAFDSVPTGVADHLEAIADRIETAGAELVVLEGNHDTMLESIWDGPVSETHWLDESTVVVHGHELPTATADRYVLGHDHPAIEIEGRRHPCFLQGPGGPGGAAVLVLPAFNRFTAGVRVNGMTASDFDSPLIVDADALAPVVRDTECEETLRFPRLGQFRHRL